MYSLGTLSYPFAHLSFPKAAQGSAVAVVEAMGWCLVGRGALGTLRSLSPKQMIQADKQTRQGSCTLTAPDNRVVPDSHPRQRSPGVCPTAAHQGAQPGGSGRCNSESAECNILLIVWQDFSIQLLAPYVKPVFYFSFYFWCISSGEIIMDFFFS